MPSNTHRAVLETSVPPELMLIAAGPFKFCCEALREWLVKHRPTGLGEYETAYVAHIEREMV